MSKFLIIAPEAQADQIASTMIACKVFNFGILFNIDGQPHVRVTNHFFNDTKTYPKLKRTELAEKIFPDKLKDMNKHKYRAYVQITLSNDDKQHNRVTTKYMYFLQEVAKIQNAKVTEIRNYEKDYSSLYNIARNTLLKQDAELVMSEVVQVEPSFPKLHSYDESYFCAVIPKTNVPHVARQIFLRFQKDFQTLYIYACMIIMVFILWLFRNHGANNSHWRAPFVIWASLYEQHLDNRATKRVFVFMMQLITTGLYLRSMYINAIISSHMTVPDVDLSYKTWDDLVQSSENFGVGKNFHRLMKFNEQFRMLEDQGRITILNNTEDTVKSFKGNVTICNCDLVPIFLKSKHLKADSFYILQQKLEPHFNQLEAGYLNPYLSRLQQYMNWAFEGGLTQIWEQLFNGKMFGVLKNDYEKDGDQYLKWKEIRVAFLQLHVGLFLSIIAFIGEHVWFRYGERIKKMAGNAWRRVRRVRIRMPSRRTLKRWLRLEQKQKQRRPQRPIARRVRVRPIDV
jgi:hypothetical protein